MILHERSPRSVTEIADQAEIRLSTMTRVVQRLDRNARAALAIGLALGASSAGGQDALEQRGGDVEVDGQPAEVVDGVQGIYSQDKYLWIDPVTGSIINQTQQELRTLENGEGLEYVMNAIRSISIFPSARSC